MLSAIRIKQRMPLVAGKLWGPAGAYECLVGEAAFEIDPSAPASQVVRDIQSCQRSPDGKVRFSADLVMFRPTDFRRASGLVLFEVVNRGIRLLPWMLQRAPFSTDPTSEKDLGDGLLLNAGHTIVWLGWQWDVPKAAGLLRADLPKALGISGLVRSEFVCDAPVRGFSLGDGDHTPYRVSDQTDPRIRLTVRDSAYGERTTMARDQWRFGRELDGKFEPDSGSLWMEAELSPGRIYEIVYPANDPVVAGLGLAGIRDLVSFLKYGGSADVPPEIFEIHHHTRAAAIFGASQSGRFVRHFLYDGFNQDEHGAKVFDGAWAHLAGAARGSFNHRFAQPSRGADPQVNHDYPTFLFPFADQPQANSGSVTPEGLLDRCHHQQCVPKFFCTNTSYEYWAFCASLIHTGSSGTRGAAIADTTRIYHLAGAQHVPGPWPPVRRGSRYDQNPNDFGWALRALMERWIAWVLNGVEPPPSVFPSLTTGTLVGPEKTVAPGPGVPVPAPYRARRLDFGPDFRLQGIVANEPPKAGELYPSLVPSVDADGNELSGIRTPDIAVPAGTFTGWNYRAEEAGAPATLADNVGSYFPFAKSAQDRKANSDSRPSLMERYPTVEQYRRKLADHVRLLVRQGFLRERDADSVIAQCRSRFAYARGGEER